MHVITNKCCEGMGICGVLKDQGVWVGGHEAVRGCHEY